MNNIDRVARARMEQAEKIAQRGKKVGQTDAKGAFPRRPQRYKLYDRIRDKVSVSMINVIIVATVLLLIIALVYGIATGTPQG